MKKNKWIFITSFILLGLLLITVSSYMILKNEKQHYEKKPVLKDLEINRTYVEEKEVKDLENIMDGVSNTSSKESIAELVEENIEQTYSVLYTTTSLNIRTGASVDSEIYTTVSTNTKLEVADNFHMNGWKMIKYDNKDLYVNGKYLSDKPVEINENKKSTNKKIASNKLIGKFRITHYAGDTATSTGARPTVGRTIAVDPRVIPYGSRVIINGHTYIAEDCGGAIKGNKIDIFVGSESEAYRKGVYHTNVYWG